MKIAVLGAGHMGGALVGGLLAARRARPRDLWENHKEIKINK